jgi:hypothetical protein
VLLSSRARLLASIMVRGPLKDQIAQRAGVAPDSLIATAPTDAPAYKHSELRTKIRASDPDTRVLEVSVNDVPPIITADAQAPTPAAAAAISRAAVSELKLYLQSMATAQKVSRAHQLILTPLGPAKSWTVPG